MHGPAVVVIVLGVAATAFADPAAPPKVVVGVDGTLEYGAIGAMALLARLEYRDSPHTALVAHAGYGSLTALEADAPSTHMVAARFGARWYLVHFYGTLEVGGLALNDHGKDEEGWSAWPTITAGLGWKLGRVDIGLECSAPLVSFGLHLGVDVGRW